MPRRQGRDHVLHGQDLRLRCEKRDYSVKHNILIEHSG